jgi:5S rRNA maturation endonuclease (ribonuclease M5)
MKKMIDIPILKKEACERITDLLDHMSIDYTDIDPNIFARCPVHGGDNERGFSFSKEKSTWRCWTHNCHDHYGTDILSLFRGIIEYRGGAEGVGPAIGMLCRILKFDKQASSGAKIVTPLDENLKEIITLSSLELISDTNPIISPIDLSIPSAYYASRENSEETLRHFGVGDYYGTDTFGGRAMIPVHNSNGDLIAYSGRAIKEFITPKFIFTKGFQRNYCLYNHHRALEHAKKTQTLFITEGPGDVWRLFECGVKNAVAIFGKSISQNQIYLLLSSDISKVVVLTDNDQAGRECKIEMQRKLGRYFTLVFPRMTQKDLGCMTIEKIKSKILTQTKGCFSD